MQKYMIWHSIRLIKPLFLIYMPSNSDKVNVEAMLEMFGKENIYTIVAMTNKPKWSHVVYTNRILQCE